MTHPSLWIHLETVTMVANLSTLNLNTSLLRTLMSSVASRIDLATSRQ